MQFWKKAAQNSGLKLLATSTEGMAVDVVKNITEYGAFVDLGGVDGLLHVTDMAWRRVNHPSEILTIGETIHVQVIKINKDTHRISLGMKQLQEDPDLVAGKYPSGIRAYGDRHKHHRLRCVCRTRSWCRRTCPRVEMSRTKKNVHLEKSYPRARSKLWFWRSMV